MLCEERTARLKSALIEEFETLHFAFADGSVGLISYSFLFVCQ
jgi:prepilin-type processing-associated H-X9-DG protein